MSERAYVFLVWCAAGCAGLCALWLLAGWLDARNEAVRRGDAARAVDLSKVDEYGTRIAARKLRRAGRALRDWWLKDHEPTG